MPEVTQISTELLPGDRFYTVNTASYDIMEWEYVGPYPRGIKGYHIIINCNVEGLVKMWHKDLDKKLAESFHSQEEAVKSAISQLQSKASGFAVKYRSNGSTHLASGEE